MENLPLTKDQQRIFDLCENSGRNILIVGKPGVGKSVLNNALLTLSKKYWTMAAPTGLAAINVCGKTLHSLFGIPVSQGIFHPNFRNFTTNDNILRNLRYTVKRLIIDEISMVRADTFDYIDRLLKFVKGNDLPFGGIQVVIVGDFFQLPPIVTRDEVKPLKEFWESEFVFSSKAFLNGNFQIEELTEVLRQKGDNKFIDILHSARTGDIDLKQLALLNNQVHPSIEDIRIRLSGTKKQAEEVNQSFLSKISEPGKSYEAKIFGNWPEKDEPLVLNLKPGAQVMVKLNGADRPEGDKGSSSVVNGSLGTVLSLADKSVDVRLDNGTEVTIYRRRREHKVKELIDGVWGEKVLASFEQIPLMLSWAISIHKSQGQSFDKAHVDASKIFAPGQLYVALSRVRSLSGLTLQSRLSTDKFWANENVIKFFETINV